MSRESLIRWSGMAAIIGGVLNVLGSVVSGSLGSAGEWVFILGGLATQFALIGVYVIQNQESGAWGFLGFVLALAGNAFFIGGSGEVSGVSIEQLGGSVYALGLILMAVGFWRAGKLPRGVPILWLVAVVVGLPAFFIPGLEALAFIGGAVLFGAGFIWAGYAMWTGKYRTAS